SAATSGKTHIRDCETCRSGYCACFQYDTSSSASGSPLTSGSCTLAERSRPPWYFFAGGGGRRRETSRSAADVRTLRSCSVRIPADAAARLANCRRDRRQLANQRVGARYSCLNNL